MRAGTLKDRITFQRQAPSGSDDSWGPTSGWFTEARVWASVQAEAGTEGAGDHGVMTAVTYTIKTRFVAGITASNRITWNNKTLDIVSVIDPTGRSRELEIKAIENVTTNG
jgi:SPP1 family predicted phage head-tail adaptor